MMWVALAFGACATPPMEGGQAFELEKAPFVGMRISQVAYDTPGEEAFEEFVEIFNRTGADIALAGWSFKDENGEWPFPENAVIGAGDVFTVARDRDGFFELGLRGGELGLLVVLHGFIRGSDVVLPLLLGLGDFRGDLGFVAGELFFRGIDGGDALGFHLRDDGRLVAVQPPAAQPGRYGL